MDNLMTGASCSEKDPSNWILTSCFSSIVVIFEPVLIQLCTRYMKWSIPCQWYVYLWWMYCWLILDYHWGNLTMINLVPHSQPLPHCQEHAHVNSFGMIGMRIEFLCLVGACSSGLFVDVFVYTFVPKGGIHYPLGGGLTVMLWCWIGRVQHLLFDCVICLGLSVVTVGTVIWPLVLSYVQQRRQTQVGTPPPPTLVCGWHDVILLSRPCPALPHRLLNN